MKDCLKCKFLDKSDLPNLFCKLNYELVNKGDFRYCINSVKSIRSFVEKQDEEIERLEKENLELKRSLKK